MIIVVTSPSAISESNQPEELINALINSKKIGNPVAILSNGPEPTWFDEFFSGSGVQFIQERGRQNGKILAIMQNKKN